MGLLRASPRKGTGLPRRATGKGHRTGHYGLLFIYGVTAKEMTMDNSEGQLPGQSSRESAPGRPSMPGRAEAKSSDPSGPETPIASQLDKAPWLFKKGNQMVVRPRDG